jgi:uncharacterized protein
MTPDNVAVAIVALNGGELVGRTRMQKAAFLLEQSGMRSGLEFAYHHFGPFSADLARGWDNAAFDDRLTMTERPGFREMPYTVFMTDEPPPPHLGALPRDRAAALLASMNAHSDVVLELAATMVFLRGRVADPIEEVRIRKPHKATPKRLDEAGALVRDLGL